MRRMPAHLRPRDGRRAARGVSSAQTVGSNGTGRQAMRFNRRQLLKISAASASLLGMPALAAAGSRGKPLKVLILGGTGFIGPHFVHALTEAKHTVTLFNRGKRDPDAKSGVEKLLGDRNDNLKSL